MTALLFVPDAANRVARYGLARLAPYPSLGDGPFEKEWAHRACRAHMNAVECLVTFAPLVLAVEVMGSGNEITEAAAATHFFARLGHAPASILRIPGLRPVTFMIGLGAVLVLAYQLLA